MNGFNKPAPGITAPVFNGQRRTDFDDSKWVRDWHYRQGTPLAMTDIDAVYCEGDGVTPVALVDYKRMSPRPVEASGALKLLRGLADKFKLPAFVIMYNHNPQFTVHSFNDAAAAWMKDIYGNPGDRTFDEREFVTFLYRLRNRGLPHDWQPGGYR